jgi:hypothetical protein
VDKRIQIFESLLGYNALNIKTKLLCRGNKWE